MTPLAITAALIVVKMSAVLALTLAATWILRRRSAALRHWVLAHGLTLAALTPLAVAIAPQWTLPGAWIAAPAPVSVSRSALVFSSTPIDLLPSADTAAPARGPLPTATAIVSVWLLGTVVIVAVIGVGFLRLRRLASGGRVVRTGAWHEIASEVGASYALPRPVALLQSEHPSLLVTWGVLRPRVLLPAAARDWPAERIRVVLRHELAHVLRRDWAIQIAATFIGAACWFNPLAWIVVRRLRRESEYACDDIVLRDGLDGEHYAAHLLAVARQICQPRTEWVPAPAVAHSSTLEQRIQAMLNRDRDRQPPSVLARALTAMAIGLATLAVGGAALSAAASPVVPTVERSDVVLPALADLAARPEVARAEAVAQTPQRGTGSISGRMWDQSGGVLPGVELRLTRAAADVALRTYSDGSGAFRFADVAAGPYQLVAVLPGFRTTVLEVSVASDRVLERSITLQLGSLEETITVVGERGSTAAAAAAPIAPFPPPPPPPAVTRPADPATFPVTLQPGPVRVGGVIRAPTKTRHVNPVYPSALQVAGIEGLVSLRATIDPDGHVREVTEASGDSPAPHPDLTAAAIEAVKAWQFTPTRLNNAAVPALITVSVRFSLK